MVTEQPENAVAGLYALRGGLSALSLIYDDIRQKDEEYYEQLHKVADMAGGARYEAPQGTVEYANWLIGDGFKEELARRFYRIKQNDVADEQSAQLDSSAREYGKTATKKLLLTLLYFAITAGLVYGLLFITVLGGWQKITGGAYGEKALEGFFDYIIFGALCLIPVVTAVLAFISLGKYIKNASSAGKFKRRKKAYLRDLQKRRDEEIARVNAGRQAVQEKINKLPQVRIAAQKILNERNNAVRATVKYCSAYYKSLCEEFSRVLNERDWQNLDLIIFKIETRRADSVKEALQLIDREGVNPTALREANQSVAQTISRGIAGMYGAVEAYCTRICDRSDASIASLDVTKGQSGAGNPTDYLTIDARKVNKALLLKSGVTSLKLCRDAQKVGSYR